MPDQPVSEQSYIGTPETGYAEARYLWQTPYASVGEWERAIRAAIPEAERCSVCEGCGLTVILASNGGPGEFPACWACQGSRRS